jgi:hypothetical protein
VVVILGHQEPAGFLVRMACETMRIAVLPFAEPSRGGPILASQLPTAWFELMGGFSVARHASSLVVTRRL